MNLALTRRIFSKDLAIQSMAAVCTAVMAFTAVGGIDLERGTNVDDRGSHFVPLRYELPETQIQFQPSEPISCLSMRSDGVMPGLFELYGHCRD